MPTFIDHPVEACPALIVHSSQFFGAEKHGSAVAQATLPKQENSQLPSDVTFTAVAPDKIAGDDLLNLTGHEIAQAYAHVIALIHE